MLSPTYALSHTHLLFLSSFFFSLTADILFPQSPTRMPTLFLLPFFYSFFRYYLFFVGNRFVDRVFIFYSHFWHFWRVHCRRRSYFFFPINDFFSSLLRWSVLLKNRSVGVGEEKSLCSKYTLMRKKKCSSPTSFILYSSEDMEKEKEKIDPRFVQLERENCVTYRNINETGRTKGIDVGKVGRAWKKSRETRHETLKRRNLTVYLCKK